MKFQKVSRDANHLEIVKDLGKMGYKVIDLAAVGNSVPDIVVADETTTALVEIKMPKSQIYISQLQFLAEWPGVCGFAEVTQDVINLMSMPGKFRLTFDQKEVILNMCYDYRANSTDIRPRIRIMEFGKEFSNRCRSLGLKIPAAVDI